VAWVAERKDVLSGLLFMLTLGAYIRYVRGSFSLPRYLTVVLVFALALMCKSMVATLPFVLLLLDYWPLGRTRWASPVVAGTTVAVPPSRLLKEKVPLFALAAASSVVTFWWLRKTGGMNFTQVPFGTRMANAVLSYAGYIGKLVWPTGLAVWYPLPPELSAAAVTVAGLGLVGVTGAVIWGARHRPWLVTGWLWYLGMLVPVIGVFQGAGEAMADRFTYLPSIGLTLMLCWSVPDHLMERRNLKVITCMAAGAALLVCATLTRVQVGYWKDSETLFRHALDVTRDNWLAHNNLGIVLMRSGRMPEAIEHLEQALQINPDLAEVHYNLGNALVQAGKIKDAIWHYEQALRLEPDYAEAHNNLGIALTRSGRIPEAIEHLEQALRIKPGFAEVHFNLGIALGQAGRIPEAIEHLEQALRINPDSAEAHYDLGLALERTGRVREAIQHYQLALRIKPDYTEARTALARLQARR
jgi:Flp pilus assembly protein TadD